MLENVGFPLREHTLLDSELIDSVARVKMRQAGLAVDAACRYLRELSGGMIKCATLARAMVLDTKILFLDKPTSGLDPHRARAFDELADSAHQLISPESLENTERILANLETLPGACPLRPVFQWLSGYGIKKRFLLLFACRHKSDIHC